MSYQPAIDFIGLLRQTANGTRSVRMPGLDYVVSAFARAGLFNVWVAQTPPVANFATTVWVKPAASSWAAEASVFLYDRASAAYIPATPTLWFTLLSAGNGGANFTYLPGGVLYQWGTANVGFAAPTAIVFPIPFSVAPNVTATVSGAATVKAVGVSAITAAGFSGQTTTAAENINWHAIGPA